MVSNQINGNQNYKLSKSNTLFHSKLTRNLLILKQCRHYWSSQLIKRNYLNTTAMQVESRFPCHYQMKRIFQTKTIRIQVTANIFGNFIKLINEFISVHSILVLQRVKR